jgi:hypothetical protein
MTSSTTWQLLPKVLEAEDVRAELLRFTVEHNPKMSAEEFLDGLGLRMEAAVGRALGTKLGVRSFTEERVVFEYPPVVTVLALMGGMAAEGVRITSVAPTVEGDALEVSGVVPSSIYHYEGTLSVDLASVDGHVEARAQVVFPGQLCAFGAGRRLIRRVVRTVAVAGDRLRTCESVRRHLATTL